MTSGSRAVIWLAIVLGGAAGALAAIAGGPPPAAPNPAPSLRPVSRIGKTSAAASAPSSAEPAAPRTPRAEAATIEARAAAPISSAAATAGAPREIPTAPALPAPASAEELRQTETLCYEKNPDQCQRAAIAHETGSAGARNAAEGKRFRRIALTFYVRECEAGLPHACFVLASMYRSGTFVEQSERKALTLLDRALELCRLRPAEECKLAGVQ